MKGNNMYLNQFLLMHADKVSTDIVDINCYLCNQLFSIKKSNAIVNIQKNEQYRCASCAGLNKKPMTEETKEKIRQSNSGKVKSEETKKKISKANSNKSPDTIRKMSEAAKKRESNPNYKHKNQKSNEQYIKEATDIFKDLYDYSDTNYKNKNTKINYVCPTHGEVSQYPANHLKIGCPFCSTKRENTYSFILKCKERYGNFYNYDDTIIGNFKSMMDYICPIHGKQSQLPKEHLKIGCRECCNKKTLHRYTPEIIFEKFTEQHGNAYVYPKLNEEFNTLMDKITIVCSNHGIFYQQAWAHMNGQGCRLCGYDNRIIPHQKTTKQFINEANAKWNYLYDYLNTKYINKYTKIKYTCPIHGEQLQNPVQHIKNGCFDCHRYINDSNLEKDIFNYIQSIYNGNIIRGDREILSGKEIDILIKELNLGIEVHGLWWHSENFAGRYKHRDKTNVSLLKDIHLIQIYENEWNEKQEIVKSILCNKLNINKRVYARCTEVRSISKKEASVFLSDNHLQSSGIVSIAYGLFYNDILVACMTFSKSRFNNNYDWEMVRYCSLTFINIVGGASKLLATFKREHTGSIITYADRRYSNGNLYNKIGFTLDGITKPGYVYLKGNKAYSRINFQKHKLKNMPHYDDSLSEYEIMLLNGYDRIWDSGNLRFVMAEG